MSNEKPSVESSCLRLSRAVELIRVGDYAIAESELISVRSDYSCDINAQVAIWIMIVEGLLLYFRDLNPTATDRLRRALALSDASKLKDMAMRSAAWLAHAYFETGRYVESVQTIQRVIDAPEDVPDDARVRAYIVLASCLICAGKPDEAEQYYSVARRLAVALRDRSSLGAMMFNRLALRLNLLRISRAIGEDTALDVQSLTKELSSSVNFDNMTGARALVPVTRVLRARLFLLAGKTQLARSLLTSQSDSIDIDSRLGRRSALYLDLAWCDIDQGQYESATTLLLKSSAVVPSEMDIDDRVIYYYLLQKAAEGVGNNEIAQAARAQLCTSIENYLESRRILTDALTSILK